MTPPFPFVITPEAPAHQLQAAAVSDKVLEEEAPSQEVDGPADVASFSGATSDEASRELSGQCQETEPPSGEDCIRSMLQFDIELKRLEWLASFLNAENTGAVSDSLQDNSLKYTLFSTKLALEDFFATLNVDSDGSSSVDLWLMDLSLKEVPSCTTDHRRSCATDDRRPSSTDDAYIIHQSLYYEKTKPPRFGGGTMDTRRVSSKDVVMQAAISYSKQDIQGGFDCLCICVGECRKKTCDFEGLTII